MAARTDSLPSIYLFLFFLRGINLSVLAVEWYASVEHAIELFFLYFKESFKRFQLRNLLIAKLSNQAISVLMHWFVFGQNKLVTSHIYTVNTHKGHSHQEDVFSFSLNLAITLLFLTCVFLCLHCSLEMHFWTKGQGCQRRGSYSAARGTSWRSHASRWTWYELFVLLTACMHWVDGWSLVI